MAKKMRWGVGSNQYQKRPGKLDQAGYGTPSLPPTSAPDIGVEVIGDSGRVTWDRRQVQLELIPTSSKERGVFRFKRSLPTLIWNAAALEGNVFTLPEVRTLLDGVTVGGKPISDADQILDLSEAMNLMIARVEDGTFRLDRDISDEINSIVARHEVIEPGVIRGTGQVNGGGTVELPDVGIVPGDSVGDDGLQLVRDHSNLLATIANLEDPREQALAYGCSATRSQFYHDGNKRTSRIMMAGHLLANGFEPVNVPYSRLLEYNEALITLFSENDATDLMDFFTTCAQSE